VRPATAIAAARACGSVAVDAGDVATVQAAAERTGRRVTVLGGHELAVDWAAGYEPDVDADAIEVYRLSQTRLVALGVCLALCWQPHRGALAGRAASLAEFEQLLVALTAKQRDRATAAGAGSHAQIKGALVDLHAMGFVELSGDGVTLGPALSQLTAGDWNEIEHAVSRLNEVAR
jgi:hypothetical protein